MLVQNVPFQGQKRRHSVATIAHRSAIAGAFA
jgi:hypothetical protein